MLMLTIFACFLLLASVLLLIHAGWALMISLGYRKKNTVRVNAWLDRTKYTKQINVHDKWGRYIRCHTQAWYSYTVDGKKYTVDLGAVNVNPGSFGSSAKVIYQKNRPGRAYLEASFPTEPFVCFICAFGGALFLAGGLSILLR